MGKKAPGARRSDARSARATRPYGGKSPLERRAGRRQQLLDAGLELFGTVGYRDVTIENLIAAAGVGVRAFYEEFGTRDELFRQVYDMVIEDALESVERAIAAPDATSAEERLGRFIRAYLESTLQDRRRGRVVSIESSALDPAMDAHRNETLQRFATVAVEALPAETRRSLGNARLWSVMLGGAVNEVVIDCIVSPGNADLESLADDLTEIWMRTLRT